MALDERLKHELERAARPADPSGLYEHLIRRRERRRIARKVQSGVLAVAVIAGSVAGVYGLSRVFREGSPREPLSPTVTNGVIVFSREIPGEGEHLFAASPDGSGVRQLTPDGNAVYRSPDVSPDGRTVLVAHEIPSFERGQAVLATVPIEGGSPTWLTEETWVIVDPTWSPDGGRIAFAGSPGGPYGIYVLDLATGEARLVPGTDEMSVGQPTWSPDGTRIAFDGEPIDSDARVDESWDIYSVRLDGSDMTNLTRTPDYSETMPAWSWTRDRIAFIEIGPAEGALLTMSSTGTDTTTAYSGELAPANPVWSPDGTAIAFEGGSEGIVTVRADGTGFAALPDARGGEPAWQPLPQGTSVGPSPTPNVSPSPQEGEDIGLGLRLCDVTSVRGTFLSGYGEGQSAVVGMILRPDGSCPRSEFEMEGIAAIDLTGDGVVDIASEPFTCQQGCNVFAAPDIDGDGNDELLVQNIQFSIVGLKLFEVVPNEDEPALVAVTVAPPGDAPFGFQGFEAGEEPQFWIGGDAFIADAIRCEPREGGRVFISTTGESRPHDSPEARFFATETTFILEDGVLRVLDVREYEASLDDPSPFVTTGCGADLDPYS